MNTSASTSNEQKKHKEDTPTFDHRFRSDLKMNISYSVYETNSVLTLLINQFNKKQNERVDNETIYYGINTVLNGVDDIKSYISTINKNQSTKDSSAVNVMVSTIEQMIVKTKAVLNLLHQQFADDENGCLNNKTVHVIFESVRKDVAKIANVSDDFLDMMDKQQA